MAKEISRKDSKGRVLKPGEREKTDGGYEYRYTTKNGKRKSVFAKTLAELRDREKQLIHDEEDGLKLDSSKVTVNDIYALWKKIKKGLRENTFLNYQYMYTQYVEDDLGRYKLQDLKKSDVRNFYNKLKETDELRMSTIDGIHTVLHQVLEIAVEDDYIRANPSDNAMKELRRINNTDKKKQKVLSVEQERLFLDFIKSHETFSHWYPIFAVLIGTGLRAGEATGLTWSDIDFEKNIIDVNHTLVYYNREHTCTMAIHPTKTEAGTRIVPMTEEVKSALKLEKRRQEREKIVCQKSIGGYDDFVFLNRFGCVYTFSTLNKAIKRITRECNAEILDNYHCSEEVILIPNFSCHSLRHTFTTRMCESGANMKAIQAILGHSDITTTLNIYTSVTDGMKSDAMKSFTQFVNS